MKIWETRTNLKNPITYLYEGPWYIFFIEEILIMIDDKLPKISIPFGSKIKMKDPIDPEDPKISLKEYYDGIDNVIRLHILDPLRRKIIKYYKCIDMK